MCALVLAAAAPSARAQVLEIADDGAVIRHSGPAQYLSPDLRPRYLNAVPAAPVRAGAAPPVAVAGVIHETAARLQLDPRLLEAVAWQESRFRADAVSPKGALGVMQLMPSTARQLGVDALDLRSNILGGGVYLQAMLRRYRGDLPLALAAYNAGPGAIDRRHGGELFPETQAYVAAVLQRLARQDPGGPDSLDRSLR